MVDACGEKIAESSCCDSVVDAVAAVACRVKMGEAEWELCAFVGNMPDFQGKNTESDEQQDLCFVHLYRMGKILARFEDMTLVAFGWQTQQTNNSAFF